MTICVATFVECADIDYMSKKVFIVSVIGRCLKIGKYKENCNTCACMKIGVAPKCSTGKCTTTVKPRNKRDINQIKQIQDQLPKTQ